MAKEVWRLSHHPLTRPKGDQGPHRMGQRVHAPTVLGQQAAGILHTPVGRRMQRGPAVPIPELRVVASLEEQPRGQTGSGSKTRREVWAKGCGGSTSCDRAKSIPGQVVAGPLPQAPPHKGPPCHSFDACPGPAVASGTLLLVLQVGVGAPNP